MEITPAPSDKTPRATADWERIEAQYRVGIMSLREIGLEHGLTEGAIRKRAKRDKWPRDLQAKVRAKADALVREDTVRAVRAKAVRQTPPRQPLSEATEAQTVDIEAQVQARIRLSHRKDVGRSRALVMTLLDELEFQTANPEILAALGDLMKEPGAQDKLAEAYRRVVGLSGRVSNMKALAEALRVLVGLERECYSLDSEADTGAPELPSQLAAFMGQIHESGAGRLPIVPRRPQ